MLSTTTSVSGTKQHTLTSKFNLLFDKSPEWISFKPQLGLKVYPCYSCKNMFSTKQTFQDHVNRRVIIIKYKCVCCSNTLTYYNRCAFLLHTRKHYTLAEGSINLSNVEIHLLSPELTGFTREQAIPYLYDEHEDFVDETIYINAQFYNPDEKDRGAQLVTLKPFNLVFHYTQNETNVLMVLKQISSNIPLCEFVSQEFNNRKRVICAPKDLPNLVPIKQEPLDGEDPKRIALNFSTLPKPDITTSTPKKPLTTQKQFASCPECMGLQHTPMAYHFVGRNKPTDERLICLKCKYIASTKCSLKAHERIHTAKPPFVCPDCGKLFRSAQLLTHHMDDVCFHSCKQVRLRCPAQKCGKLFVLASSYGAHFANHFQCLNRCSVCNAGMFTDVDFMDHTKVHKGQACAPNKTYTCMVCKTVPVFSEDEYPEHLAWHVADREKFVYIYTCKYCKSYFRSTSTYGVHRQRCAKNGDKGVPVLISVKCHFCPQKVLFREGEAGKACTGCKQLNRCPKVSNRCKLCKLDLANASSEEHFGQCKYKNAVVNISVLSDQEASNDSTKSGKKRKRTPNSGKVRRGEEAVDMQAEEPVAFDGTYYCKLCDFRCGEREGFHGHVMGHRDVSTAYQCMECGECFVVKPSLVKHLLHFHKISDVDEYLAMNSCFDKVAIEGLENKVGVKGDVKENQCGVCLEQFEDALTLSKHFRIHGLAFLKNKGIK